MIDPNRATFVQHEHRYSISENLAVRATYPSARELVRTTNLTTADADAMAAKLLNENASPALAFRIEVEGIYDLETIEGGPPRWTLDLPLYVTDGRVFKTAEIEVDYLRNRTTFVVRG